MRFFKVMGLIVLGLIALGQVAVPAARSATQIPLVPTSTRPAPMTLTPTATSAVNTPTDKGASLELKTVPGRWTVVQWQDTLGAWHYVDGWQGTADGQGAVRWWVSSAQFGQGPFRWAVYDKPGGTILSVSRPFGLPQVARQRVVVEVALKP
jgi:hypothetical protein